MKALLLTISFWMLSYLTFSQVNNPPVIKSGTALKILNIDEIGTKTTGRYLIHFTGRQWMKAVSDLKLQEIDLKELKDFDGIIFFSTGEDPSKDGMYMVPPECNPPCELIYKPKQLPRCDCTGVNLPCNMYLRLGKLACTGACGNNKDCEPYYRRFKVGIYTFYGFSCKCK